MGHERPQPRNAPPSSLRRCLPSSRPWGLGSPVRRSHLRASQHSGPILRGPISAADLREGPGDRVTLGPRSPLFLTVRPRGPNAGRHTRTTRPWPEAQAPHQPGMPLGHWALGRPKHRLRGAYLRVRRQVVPTRGVGPTKLPGDGSGGRARDPASNHAAILATPPSCFV
ncbi:hypothetical protein NDU88_003629 [Pleurodeles waltl]|uniref:Uncharacterized protein n=1 Tax=Pleurodeles waltl TaxID=8319 RepID=A0AAV7W430_PLEWA|nr:hypothetical protein NDU88_003629 [Pleurodeles waltl]